MASGVGAPYSGSPVIDMIEMSDATRPGCSMATVWAIIPPIDAPITWARGMRRWSSRPTASTAMSDSVYGTGGSGCSDERGVDHRHQVDLGAVEAGRQAAVAVVVADDVVPAGRQPGAQGVVPGDELGGEAHDEEEGRVVG